ncbi:saccharopine dehydrogenase NADP-binding domain-containing protein [Actinoplanes rectilineatus]|uniref:saccharopine dehydrogenase NADP-binding domain-containing protein n=1 Tax=Actinoplanes rectilineatus TaxID=113571 RepID=UPI0005F2C7F7|nr:saccharopine dehydrogenase NADP-binding domain-containing protein [Actinoplanes rectilineatus]
MNKRVAVPGAGGHTGTFVQAELRSRGLTPIPCDRNTDLDQAFRQADAVINCAGPFAATARPTIEAAIRAGVPYLDVTAEVEVIGETLTDFADAPIPIVPAVAFYGGLGDLLATALLGDGSGAERLLIAYTLSDWHPTRGTRATGLVSAQRRGGRRIVWAGGRWAFRDGDAPVTNWAFPDTERAVVGEFTMADSATVPAHLTIPDISTFMTMNAVADLRDPDTGAPVAADESGRSAQTFLVDVIAETGGTRRRMIASGRDIYAITAPLVVEAATRILDGTGAAPGAIPAGARFDAEDFLISIGPQRLVLDRQ